MRYRFESVARCNMCGSPAARVLGKRLNQSQGANPRTRTGLATTVVQCALCGLIYANPLPIPDNMQDHYGIPPESYWKEEYFSVDAGYFQGEIERLRQLMRLGPKSTALDIGAGIGKCMIVLERAGFDVFGLEPGEEFHKRAIARMGIRPERLALSSLEQASYEPGTFDFINFGATLEHLYDPSQSIRKAMTWLKPGGLIHAEVPSSKWLIGKLANIYYRAIGTDYVTNLSPMHPPFHLYEFDIRSFTLPAAAKGYEVVFHEYFVCPTYMPRMADMILVPLMKAAGSGMQLAVWIRKLR